MWVLGTVNWTTGPMKRFRFSFAAIALLLGTGFGTAQAASLSTDLNVNISTSMVLACFDEVDVDLSSETFIAAVGRNGDRAMPSRNITARARDGVLVANAGRRFWRRGR